MKPTVAADEMFEGIDIDEVSRWLSEWQELN